MKVKLSKEDIELIGNALISHRWKIEDAKGQNDDFHRCASLADRLSCNHNGGVITFNTPDEN